MEYLLNPEIWLPALVGILFTFLIMMSRISSLKATLHAQNRVIKKIEAEKEAHEGVLNSELSQLRQSESGLLKRQGQLETMLDSQIARHRETENLLETAEERFSRKYKTLSADALKQSQQQIANLVQSTFGNEIRNKHLENQKKQDSLLSLLQIVSNKLSKIEKGLEPLTPLSDSPKEIIASAQKFQGFTIGDLEIHPEKITAAEAAANDLRSALDDPSDYAGE